jgi:hypothetical protein
MLVVTNPTGTSRREHQHQKKHYIHIWTTTLQAVLAQAKALLTNTVLFQQEHLDRASHSASDG